MRTVGSFIRIKSVDEVRASLDTFGEGVAEKLAGAPEGQLEGGSGFSYETLFEDIDSRLASARELLVKAEDDHVRNLIRFSDLRREGDELTTTLYIEQVSVRRTFAGVYGPEHGFELAAIQGDTPQELKPLSDQVDLTIKLLREPEIEVPATKVGGVQVDFDAMAASLESRREAIEQVGGQLDRARKAVGKTVVLKHQATAEFDRVFPWAAQIAEGAFRMAGERELADRIRTSRRRVAGRQAAETEETASEESSSGGSEAEGNVPSSSEAVETVEAVV